MNIKEAKNEIKNAVRIYVDKDENGKRLAEVGAYRRMKDQEKQK